MQLATAQRGAEERERGSAAQAEQAARAAQVRRRAGAALGCMPRLQAEGGCASQQSKALGGVKAYDRGCKEPGRSLSR